MKERKPNCCGEKDKVAKRAHKICFGSGQFFFLKYWKVRVLKPWLPLQPIIVVWQAG